MTPLEELHSIIRAAIGDDAPEAVAARVGVSVGLAKRWRSRVPIPVPSRRRLDAVLGAYGVGIRDVERAHRALDAVRRQVVQNAG